jgi:hypothetical protein
MAGCLPAGCTALDGVNVGANIPIGGPVNVGVNKTIGSQGGTPPAQTQPRPSSVISEDQQDQTESTSP